MRNIALSDQLYDKASRAAEAYGQSVEEFVAEVLGEILTSDRDRFFTPKVISEIRDAAVEARQGRNVSIEDMRVRLATRRQAWLERQS